MSTARFVKAQAAHAAAWRAEQTDHSHLFADEVTRIHERYAAACAEFDAAYAEAVVLGAIKAPAPIYSGDAE